MARRILIVEDNVDLRRLIQLALELRKFSILVAGNGEEALRLMQQHPVDVVLTDIFMPDMDGIEVIAAIRRMFPAVRVLAMSGRPTGDVYLSVARELGCEAIFRKPFDVDELIAVIAAPRPGASGA